jgi:hypothetical protein
MFAKPNHGPRSRMMAAMMARDANTWGTVAQKAGIERQ